MKKIRAHFDIVDILDDAELTSLHRIMLGLSPRDLAEELEEHLELVNVTDVNGQTPLYWAVWREDLVAMRLLLEHGADMGVTTADGYNVLHLIAMASSSDGTEMFSLLCTEAANLPLWKKTLSSWLNEQNIYGLTPWSYAIEYRRTSLLQSFLEYELDLGIRNTFGMSLFHIAAMHADVKMLRFFAEIDLRRVDLLAVNKYGDTALAPVVARLNDAVYWIEAPGYSAEAEEALVKLVAHARKSESRLPRLIYGVKIGEEDYEAGYGLFDRGTDPSSNDHWAKWVDVEEWLGEHTHLDMREAWESDTEESSESDEMGESENGERFFDAVDSTSLCRPSAESAISDQPDRLADKQDVRQRAL